MTKENPASEAEEFAGAVAEFTANPNSAGPIAVMMRLALEATNVVRRLWAAAWLLEKCDITVVTENEEHHHAVAAPAGGIL